MREIKFRGKCIETGKWVYGGYHEHTKRQINPVGDELKDDDIAHLIIQSGFADWNMPKPLHAIEVDPKTVGQCTGLKDMNGVEIYEGDILVDAAGQLFEVKYGLHTIVTNISFDTRIRASHIGWFLRKEKNGGIVSAVEITYTKKAGNIYENADLLEVK